MWKHLDAILVAIVVALMGGGVVMRSELPSSFYLVAVLLAVIAAYADYYIVSHYI